MNLKRKRSGVRGESTQPEIPRLRIGWLGLLACAVAALVALQIDQSRRFAESLGEAHGLSRSLQQVDETRLQFERYRLASKDFRRLGDAGILAAKGALKRSVSSLTSRLESTDRADIQRLDRQLDAFMALSARIEPMLFLKDVYLKDEARSAHEAMLTTLSAIRASIDQRIERNQARSESLLRQSRALQFGVAGASVVFAGFWLLSVYWAFVRPLRGLLKRAREVGLGSWLRSEPTRLRGVHAEIERMIDRLAESVEAQQRDRQRFVTELAQDLRAPVVPLQTNAQLIASRAEELPPEQRAHAEAQIRRSALRLNQTLDDLFDVLQVESGTLRLEERILDLRELVHRVARHWSGGGTAHDVRAVVPSLPVWAFVDAARLERVLSHLVGKRVQYAPQGCRLALTLRPVASPRGAAFAGGVEILVSDQGSAGRASGPEQALSRHWIAENGFGLGLAERVVRAHEGELLAAGVAGTSVQFRLRLPESRIPGGEEGWANSLDSSTRRPGLLAPPADGGSDRLNAPTARGFTPFA